MSASAFLSGLPAPRLTTARLVLRCYTPADAPLLKEALDSSLEHLCPWLPWTRPESRPLEERREFCSGSMESAGSRGGHDLAHGAWRVMNFFHVRGRPSLRSENGLNLLGW